jgi:transposase-like protein
MMKLTPERQAAFLAALATAGGNVSRACEAVDISRFTAYSWRDDDPHFAAEWERAKEAGVDALEDEARRRAFEGTAKPVFHQGVQCGTIQEYSDTLTIFLLKGARPEKYRERVSTELTGKDGGPVQIKRAADMTDDELALIAQGGK